MLKLPFSGEQSGYWILNLVIFVLHRNWFCIKKRVSHKKMPAQSEQCANLPDLMTDVLIFSILPALPSVFNSVKYFLMIDP